MSFHAPTPRSDITIWGQSLKDCKPVVFLSESEGLYYLGYLTNDQKLGYWPTTTFSQDDLARFVNNNDLPMYASSDVAIAIAHNLGQHRAFPNTWEEAHTEETNTEEEKVELEMSPTWELVDAVLNHSRRVLLMGPPGTGKTYAATRRGLDGRSNSKVYSITMTPETPMAELRGHFVPKEGEYIWMDGPAIRAWREGARLVINEIDHASPDTQSFMYALLDDPEFAETTLPTGETVRPAEGFQVVATMNGVPEDLPSALQDRFPVTLEIQELNPEALAALPEDLQYAVRNTALHKSEDRRISIRMWFEYANLRKEMRKQYGPKTGNEMAAQAVFGERAEEALNALEMAKDLTAA